MNIPDPKYTLEQEIIAKAVRYNPRCPEGDRVCRVTEMRYALPVATWEYEVVWEGEYMWFDETVIDAGLKYEHHDCNH
jgi:hypothetical protein